MTLKNLKEAVSGLNEKAQRLEVIIVDGETTQMYTASQLLNIGTGSFPVVLVVQPAYDRRMNQKCMNLRTGQFHE